MELLIAQCKRHRFITAIRSYLGLLSQKTCHSATRPSRLRPFRRPLFGSPSDVGQDQVS